jgi:hypothetical protein
MNHRKVLSRNATWLAGTVTLLGSWSCSLLYDFNTSQCNETQDCINQGPQFEHAKCVNHVCVQTNSINTGGAVSSGGSGTSGNSSDTGGSSAAGGNTPGGTSSVGGSTANGGTMSSGGSTAVSTGTSVGGVSSGGTSSTSTSVGGSGPTGGQPGIGGVGGVGGVTQIGGTSAIGGTSSAGGTQATGGSVGTGGTTGPECTTNNDCISKHNDQPYICKSGSCVLLTSPNCPVLIPQQSSNPSYNYLNLLKQASPIIVGGFANMGNQSDPHNTLALLNWDLAFDEFNTRTLGGLPQYTSGKLQRPFVGLVCQGQTNVSNIPKDIPESMRHLTQDIGVSSVLSTLAASDLLPAWNTTSANQNVFFMNTGSASLALVNTANGGMLWHMLGDPHVLAASIVALLHQMEPYIYQQRKANFTNNGGEDPDSVPLRATMVYSNHPTMLDMHDVLASTDNVHPEAQLTFNGKSLAANGANYREVEIQSANVVSPPDVAAGISDIETKPPHVILAIATSEFPKTVMQAIEAWWGTTSDSTGLIRPYYIMSHLTYNTPDLTDRTKAHLNKSPPLHLRVAGVNYAEAQDANSKALYNKYLAKLQQVNTGSTLSLTGAENYYDGAYYLLYSIAAAARNNEVPASGDIKSGFVQRVINTTNGVSVNVDPVVIADTVNKLFTTTPPFYMALWGTMGYPNFDLTLGTRISQTSAWCVQQSSGSTTGVYQPDGLIYDAPSQTYSPNSSGIPACLQNYCPPDADAGVNTCPESY